MAKIAENCDHNIDPWFAVNADKIVHIDETVSSHVQNAAYVYVALFPCDVKIYIIYNFTCFAHNIAATFSYYMHCSYILHGHSINDKYTVK
jgi:hypothetical protein